MRYQPNYATALGETIMDVLEDEQICITDFAQQLGEPEVVVLALLHGLLRIDVIWQPSYNNCKAYPRIVLAEPRTELQRKDISVMGVTASCI